MQVIFGCATILALFPLGLKIHERSPGLQKTIPLGKQWFHRTTATTS